MSKKKLTYEEAMEKLKIILAKLEEDDCTLEDSMSNFKEGMELYNHCNLLLNKAEGEITLILDKEMGSVEEVKFPLEG